MSTGVIKKKDRVAVEKLVFITNTLELIGSPAVPCATSPVWLPPFHFTLGKEYNNGDEPPSVGYNGFHTRTTGGDQTYEALYRGRWDRRFSGIASAPYWLDYIPEGTIGVARCKGFAWGRHDRNAYQKIVLTEVVDIHMFPRRNSTPS